MRTIAILLIKSFNEAKQRLQPELSAGPRRALVEAMFSDVLVALRRAATVNEILVVTLDHSAQQIAGGHGATVLDDQEVGHNAAAALGVAHAIELGFERALLVPGDCPMLAPAEIDSLLAHTSAERSAVIVPDRHGTGTNALLLTPPDALQPAFGIGSAQRHASNAAGAGVSSEVVELQSLGLDIDTPDDLEALQAALAGSHGGAAHTRGMLNQLMRSRG